MTKAYGGHQSVPVRLVVTKTVGHKGEERSFIEREETVVKLHDLIVKGGAIAEVTQGASGKVSDSVFYGNGTWDKIPYSVEVFSSVKLQCDQAEDAIKISQEIASNLARDALAAGLLKATVEILQLITEDLFKDRFNG